MVTNLKGEQVLITAGPTWVPIDNVRVISNIATGETGILLANRLAKLGAKVTLILGPVKAGGINKGVRVINFQFFNELSSLLSKEIKAKRYDIVVHSAAVADYQPVEMSKKKISSSRKKIKLTLRQTPKLINSLRKALPEALLAGFKFEPDLTKDKLICKARDLLRRARLDLVVANTNQKKHYAAYFVKNNTEYGPYLSKVDMVNNLITRFTPKT